SGMTAKRLIVRAQELEAVLKIPGPARYQYFIKKVADWQSAWGLWRNGGWVWMGDSSGGQSFPIWPAKEYAEACAEALGWPGAEADEIALMSLRDELIPKLLAKGMGLAIFPGRDG